MRYQELPKSLGIIDLVVDEYFSYQYLPIKMAESTETFVEPRLLVFKSILAKALCNYIAEYGVTRYFKSYVYITAKNMFQAPDCSFNRPGYHIDGFLKEKDINYIWSNKNPTVFNKGEFNLSDDDQISLKEMEEQALVENDVTYPNCSLLRLNNQIVHKVADFTEPCVRAFLKVSISPDRYNLIGNSKNYLIDYNWPMRPRNIERNIPQEIKCV